MRKLWILGVAILVIAYLIVGLPATAQSPTEPETGPALRVEPAGKPLALHFTSDGTRYRGSIAVTSVVTEVTGTALTNFTDLTPIEGTAPPVLGADVTVSPSGTQTLGPGETRLFALSFPKPSLPGTYRGSVEVTYKDRPGDEKYVVQLELIAALPTITIEPTDHKLPLIQEQKGGPYKATFSLSVTEGEINKVTFTKNNLDRTAGQGRIFADKVSIDPTTTTLGPDDPPATFTVSVIAAEEGTYEGSLLLSYFGSAADKAQGLVTLTLELTASPEADLERIGTDKLQIKSYLGEKVPRTLLLHEKSEANDAKQVVFEPQDMLGREDQSLALPAQVVPRIQGTSQISTTVPRGGYAELPVLFDFSVPGTRAGTFSGNLIVSSENAEDLVVPVEVTLKHNWWPWPLLALILGIILGLYLTWYRSDYRDKDEQVRAIEHLESHLEANTGKPFHAFYSTAATTKLALARQMLTTDWPDGLEQAKALVVEVRTYWVRWEQHHTELEAQRRLILELDNKLGQFTDYAYAVAIQERLQTIYGRRHTYQDGAAMKKDVDAERSRLTAFLEAYNKGEIVAEQLKAIAGELEGTVEHGFKDRIAQQQQNLKAADEDSEVQAIEAHFDAIQAELQTAYQDWPHFYYDDEGGGCTQHAQEFIGQIDALDEAGPHWPAVRDKLEAARREAESYMQSRNHFVRASQLAHNVWRAAWCYLKVIIPVRQKLDQQHTSTDPWKAVLTAVEEIENWLVATSYGDQAPDAFDQQLLVTWMGTLYQKLGQAEGVPVPSPTPPPRPIKPYRGLPDVSDGVTSYSAPRAPSVTGIDFTVTGVKLVATIRQWLRDRFETLYNLGRLLIGDPTVRYLSYEAAVTILSIVLLAGIGMLKLWADDATFGESFLDYFTLFIWGFGANATKDSVLQVVRAWGGKTPIQ